MTDVTTSTDSCDHSSSFGTVDSSGILSTLGAIERTLLPGDDSLTNTRRDLLEQSVSASSSLYSACSVVSLTRLNQIITRPEREDLNRLMKDQAFVDYFNVFLNLPIFPQRVLYDVSDNKFTFDPPVLFGTLHNEIPTQLLSCLGHWIIDKRYPLYLESELFWEYLLCVDLLTPEPFDVTNRFTALSCNKFVYETVGNVIGMRRFKAHIQGTPGERIFSALRDLDRFIHTPKSHPDRFSIYKKLRTMVLAAKSESDEVFFPYDEVYDDEDIEMSTLELLRHVFFFTLKVYWLPRFMLHSCPLKSKRRIKLEKEIHLCRRMVGKYLLNFPSLAKYELMQACYDSILPVREKKLDEPKLKPSLKLKRDSSSSLASTKSSKATEIMQSKKLHATVCAQRKPSYHSLVNRMFPLPPSTLQKNKSEKQDKKDNDGHKDICICVESRDGCTCNDGVVLCKEDLNYEPVHLPSINDVKCLSSKEGFPTPQEDSLVVKKPKSQGLSRNARMLFEDIDNFYKVHPTRSTTLPPTGKKSDVLPSISARGEESGLDSSPQVAGSEAGESLDSLDSSVDDDDDMRRGDSLLSSLDLSDNTDPGSVTSIRSAQLTEKLSRLSERERSVPGKRYLPKKLSSLKSARNSRAVHHMTRQDRWRHVASSIDNWRQSRSKHTRGGRDGKTKESSKQRAKKIVKNRRVIIVEKLRMMSSGQSLITRSEEVVYTRTRESSSMVAASQSQQTTAKSSSSLRRIKPTARGQQIPGHTVTPPSKSSTQVAYPSEAALPDHLSTSSHMTTSELDQPQATRSRVSSHVTYKYSTSTDEMKINSDKRPPVKERTSRTSKDSTRKSQAFSQPSSRATSRHHSRKSTQPDSQLDSKASFNEDVIHKQSVHFSSNPVEEAPLSQKIIKRKESADPEAKKLGFRTKSPTLLRKRSRTAGGKPISSQSKSKMKSEEEVKAEESVDTFEKFMREQEQKEKEMEKESKKLKKRVISSEARKEYHKLQRKLSAEKALANDSQPKLEAANSRPTDPEISLQVLSTETLQMRQRKNTAETEVSQAASDDLTTGYTVPPQHTQPPQHHQPSQPAQQAQSPPQIQLSKRNKSVYDCVNILFTLQKGARKWRKLTNQFTGSQGSASENASVESKNSFAMDFQPAVTGSKLQVNSEQLLANSKFSMRQRSVLSERLDPPGSQSKMAKEGAVSSGMNVSGTILFLRNSEVRQKRSGPSKSARLAKTAAAQKPDPSKSDLPLAKLKSPKDSDPASLAHSSTTPSNQKKTKVSAGSNSVSAHGKFKAKSSVSQAKSSLLGVKSAVAEEERKPKKEPFKFVQTVCEDQTQYMLTEDDKKAFQEYHKSSPKMIPNEAGISASEEVVQAPQKVRNKGQRSERTSSTKSIQSKRKRSSEKKISQYSPKPRIRCTVTMKYNLQCGLNVNKKVAVFDSKEDRLEREHSMSLDKSNTSQTVAHGKSRSGTVGATQSEKKIIPCPRRESVTITFNGLNTQGGTAVDTDTQSPDGHTNADKTKLKALVKGIKASRKPKQNNKQPAEMTELHPTDSLLGDLQNRTSNVSPTRHAEQAERVRAARNAMCKSPKPASEYRQWKLSDSPSGKKNNDRLFPNIHEKQTPKQILSKSDGPMKQASAFVNETATMLDAGPHPLDTSRLQLDIAECTKLRKAAGDALPVIPGTTHINKVMYPAAPNFTIWNYLIQGYDIVSPNSYRVQHQIFLLSMKSDRYAGSPFLKYLQTRNVVQKLNTLMFWLDADLYLNSNTKKGKLTDQLRLKTAKDLIVNYLLPTSRQRVEGLSDEVRNLLIYALQLDEGEEILKYCQDVAIEHCRSLWKSYIKFDKVNFNQFLRLTDMHAMVDAIRLDSSLNQSDQDFMKIQSEADDSSLPPIGSKVSKVMSTESFQIKLSADKDALRMQGDNKRLETYFKTEKHGRNKSDKGSFTPPVAILPTKEAGLISVDTSSIKAAYQLACHPDLNNTKEIKIDKSQRGKGSMRILMDHSKKNAKEKTLPNSIRRMIGIDKQKPVKELRIARYDIGEDPRDQSTTPNSQRKSTSSKAEVDFFGSNRKRSDSVHGSQSSDTPKKKKLGAPRASRPKILPYLEPIIKNGRCIERPKKRPLSLHSVLNDPTHREFFYKFLEYYHSEWPLKLWIDCNEIKTQIKNRNYKKKKLEQVNNVHFRRESNEEETHYFNRQMEKYQIDDPQFKAIIRAEKISVGQIDLVMSIIFQYLASNWFGPFKDTFEDELKENSGSRHGSAVLTNWRRISWTLIDFYRGIKDRQLRKRFLVFIKHQNEKIDPSAQMALPNTALSKMTVGEAGSGLAPITLSKKLSHTPLSRGSLPPSIISSAAATTKAKGNTAVPERDQQKIPNDIVFLLEGSRYYSVVRNVRANESQGLEPRDDFIYAKAKAKAIVDRFLDSEVPPKNQINVPQNITDHIVKTNRVTTADLRLFIEAEMVLIFPAMLLWKRFLKSYWIGCSFSRIKTPEYVEPIPAYPFHDTVKYEYVMVNSTGETESTRILTSVEGGIRQYIFIQRHLQHTIPANSSYTGTTAVPANNIPPVITPGYATNSGLNNVALSASAKPSRLNNSLNHASGFGTDSNSGLSLMPTPPGIL